MADRTRLVSLEQLGQIIYLLRGQKVMMDLDLAALYAVETRVLNQAVKRNSERFPADFMFRLSKDEMKLLARLRDQAVSSINSSQIVMSSPSRRGLAYRYYAFTEQGVAMLSSVLRSPRAVQVNIEIMRAFVRLRQLLASNVELSRRLDQLEKKYNRKFRVVFDVIREMMSEGGESRPAREIGFHTGMPARDTKVRTKKAIKFSE